MTQQEFLFTDPALPAEAKPRLGGQNGKILAALREGPKTNIQLEQISGSRRINSRVADVRRWLREVEEKTIQCVALDARRGVYLYGIRR